LATELVGPRSARLIPEILAAPYPAIRHLRAFRRRADPALREYRLYGSFEARRRMMMREWSLIWWKLKHWYLGSPARSTRTLPQGGAFIAFLGADGAGKSTLTQVIADWLSSDIAVATTYGGSGKGSASFPRRMLQGIGSALRKVARSRARTATGAKGSHERPPRIWTIGRLIWVLTLNWERRRRALFARQARARGMVLLTDRLPQRQFPGLNDGTRLSRWLDHPRGLRRRLADWEQATFRLVELTPPELVVKLHVSLARSLERKPETPEEQLRTGIELSRRLQFPAATTIVDVDADLPLATVVRQVKRAVWECL
jgi:energy-coupling factor transporter ATP-binding protein EcfA2